MNILETLNKLNACHAPSGEENEIAEQIKALSLNYADEVYSDVLGNLIVHKRGAGPKVLFAAHMDSIGFMITHIDKEGFLRFGKIGALSPEKVLHTSLRFKNGTAGTVCLDQSVEAEKMTLDDLYIDIGATDKEEAEKYVKVGDTAVYDLMAKQAKSRIISPYLDNRSSCIALLMGIANTKNNSSDLYFVFTVQEEVGLRGAKPAAFSIEPAYAVVCDVTPADDQLGAKHFGSSKLGGGAAIKVMDTSVICHPQMVTKLSVLAQDHKIPFQTDVIRRGGTDAGPIHVSKAGVLTGGISIPCRYVHSPQEMVDLSDIESCAKLITAFAECEL
ncbi:MAG: M42 family peptidase [Clostridia bacterium]|nr:M42 family peptidase [Clostridia bacterium]